jgi:hypothetical protein
VISLISKLSLVINFGFDFRDGYLTPFLGVKLNLLVIYILRFQCFIAIDQDQ